MGTKFSQQEKAVIRLRLKDAAKFYAATRGLRKTTVDDLARVAGISKGTFYNFYETKELLFFEMIADWHTRLYMEICECKRMRTETSPVEREVEVLLTCCRMMQNSDLMEFVENDGPLVMGKVPQRVLDEKAALDKARICEAIELAGVEFRVPVEAVASVFHMLVLTVAHRREFGERFDETLEIIVRGACRELLGD